jgi:hypothetical protein
MAWQGLVIGVIAFFIIGIFHPIVVKCEYYFTAKIWPIFLVGGLIFCAVSLFVHEIIASAALGVTGCTMLWCIGELKEQTQRVEKGWFPANPKRQTDQKKAERT